MTYNMIYNDPSRRRNVTEPWVYWDGMFTDDELDKIIKHCTSQALDAGTIIRPNEDEVQGVNDELRRSNINWHYRTAETEWIFDRMNRVLQLMNERFYNFDLNGYENFQYAEYDSAQSGYYDWHVDMTTGTDANSATGTRKLSMSLLLNDDFSGGEFMLNLSNQDQAITLPTPRGRAVIFPSWIPHRVAPVTSGIRRSLVVWVCGPKFI